MSVQTNRLIFLEGGEDVDPDKEYQRLVEEASIEECALTLPKGHLSASQVMQYLRCPRQFEFRVIKNIILPPSVAMAEGKAIHRGLEVGHREALKSDDVPLDILLGAHEETWKNIRSEIDWNAENEDNLSEDDVLTRSRELLSVYRQKQLKTLRAITDATGPFIERRFWVVVGESKIPLLGYIDLVAQYEISAAPIVVDHKVVSRSKSADDVSGDLQLSVYSMATQVQRVAFNCLVRTKTPSVKLIDAARTEADWRWAQFVIQRVAESIARGSFPPNPSGWWCSKKWCGYYQICRKGD